VAFKTAEMVGFTHDMSAKHQAEYVNKGITADLDALEVLSLLPETIS